MSLPQEKEWLMFKCTADGACGQFFITWGALKRHQSYTHHDRRAWSVSYTCTVCHQDFGTASALQSHAVIHFPAKGEKPHSPAKLKETTSESTRITAPHETNDFVKSIATRASPFKKAVELGLSQSSNANAAWSESGGKEGEELAVAASDSNSTPSSEKGATQNIVSECTDVSPKAQVKMITLQVPSGLVHQNSSKQSPTVGNAQKAAKQTQKDQQPGRVKISIAQKSSPAQSILQHLDSGGESMQNFQGNTNKSVSSVQSEGFQASNKDVLSESEKLILEHYPTTGGRIYLCKACGQVFVSMSRFKDHLSKHSQDVKVECRHCGKFFDNHERLARHAALHTQSKAPAESSQMDSEGRSPYKSLSQSVVSNQQNITLADASKRVGGYTCPACAETFDSSDLNQHTLIHKDITFFQCATCEQLFVTHVAFSEHLQSQCRSPVIGESVCELCNSHFALASELSQHKVHCCKVEDKTQAKSSSGKYLCADCGILFRAERPYITHLIKHAVNKAKGIEHNELECQECKQVFASLRALRKHMRMHAQKADPHPCKKCDAIFSSKRALVSHQKKHVTEPDSSTFSCQFCDWNFLNRQELKQHIRKGHADIRPHACDICDASFKAKFDLLRHKLKHEGKKFYVCQICGRDFYAKADLKQHEAAVHSAIPRTKPFMCHECGKMFFTRGHLNTHHRAHSTDQPFACPECPVRCKTKKNLEVHMRRHRGELPIKCSICGMGFVDHCYLSRHMARHKPAPDLHCHLCHKAFYQQQHLKSHIATIHFMCYDCDERFVSKKEIKLHRHECQFPGGAAYLKRSGVLSTPSAVVVEPVNPGGNMLASHAVEGSSNFADTLTPTTGPDSRDSLLFPEHAGGDLTIEGGDPTLSPFGHYNADTNTVIIYEDQLRWAKNAIDPSSSGPCTYEISIPGENSGEITKLIIEDKTGDIPLDSITGEMHVPDISQEEVVIATEKGRNKPHTAARKSRTRKTSQKLLPKHPEMEIGYKSNEEPSAKSQASQLSSQTVSLIDGLEVAAEKAKLKDLQVVLVDVKKSLQKFAGEESADLFAEMDEAQDADTCMDVLHPEVPSTEQFGETLLHFAGNFEDDQSQTLQGTVTADLSMKTGTILDTRPNTSTSVIVKADDNIHFHGLDICEDNIYVPSHSLLQNQIPNNEEKQQSLDKIPSVEIPEGDADKSEKDKQEARGNQSVGEKTLFKCCHCESMFTTHAGALTHACPLAGGYASNPVAQSSLGVDQNFPLSTSDSLISAAFSSVNTAAVVQDSSTVVTDNGRTVQTDTISSVSSTSSALSYMPLVASSPHISKTTGPKTTTINSSSSAAESLSNSMSLLSSGQKAITHDTVPASTSSLHVCSDKMAATSLKVPNGAAVSDTVSLQVPTQGNVSAGETQAPSTLTFPTILVSHGGNVVRLTPHLSGAGSVTQNQTSSRVVKQALTSTQPSPLIQTAQKLNTQLLQQAKIPGLTKFKCYHCRELFPTIEAVIIHSQTHSAPVTSSQAATVTKTTTTSAAGQPATSALTRSASAVSVSNSSDKTGSVLISLPVSNTADKTRVIALPGKTWEVTKPLSSQSTRTTACVVTQPQDLSPSTDIAKQPGVAADSVDRPSLSAPTTQEKIAFCDSSEIHATADSSNPESAEINADSLSLLKDISDRESSAPSGNSGVQDDLKEKPQPKLTKTMAVKVQGRKTEAPSKEKPANPDNGTVKAGTAFTTTEDMAASNTQNNIFFQCNDCGDCFTTVAAFANHAKQSHPKPKQKQQRPGRHRSMWKKHKQQWEELEKAAFHEPVAKDDVTPKAIQTRRHSPRNAKKEHTTQAATETAAPQTPSKRRRQVSDTSKREETVSVSVKEVPDTSEVPAPKRTRMSVLELAAAAEVVEDRMWQLDRPYQCDVCDASFSYLQQVREHLTSTHQRQEVYQCSHCVGVFSSLPALTLHFQKHAQLMAQTSTSSATQQNGSEGGGHAELQQQSTPRRRTRSSSSARGRLSSTSEPSNSMAASETSPKDKEGSRYSGGLTLESLADAAVALAERGGKMNIGSQPAAVAKTMWEACYTIGDQIFTISIAVPAVSPTKASLPHSDTGVKNQTDPSHGFGGMQNKQGKLESPLDTVASPASGDRGLPQAASQSQTTGILAESTFCGNNTALPKTARSPHSSWSEVPSNDLRTPRMEPVGTRRASQLQSGLASQGISTPDLRLSDETVSIQDEVGAEDSGDNDISIHSGNEEDEDLPVLSFNNEQTPSHPYNTRSPKKTSLVTPQKTLSGSDAKRRDTPGKSASIPKSKSVEQSGALSETTPPKYSTSESVSTVRVTRKSAKRNVLLPTDGTGLNTAGSRSRFTAGEGRSVKIAAGTKRKKASVHSRSSRSEPSVDVAAPQVTSPTSSSSSFRCEVCHETFTSKALLDTHVLSHRTSRGTYSCTSCQREFRSYPHLVTHLLQHVSGLSFRCGLCTAAFNHYAALHAHQQAHKAAEKIAEGSVLCTVCGYFLASQHALDHHKTQHHPSSRKLKNLERDMAHIQTGRQKGRVALSKLASKATVQSEIKESGVEFDSSEKTENVDEFETGSEIGDADFVENVDECLNERTVTDSEDADELCPSGDNSSQHVDQASEDHEQRKASTRSSHQVEQTNAGLHRKGNKTKSKDKPVCPVCRRSFSSSSYLKHHLKSHDNTSAASNKRPTCTTCKKTFIHEAALRAHERRHVSGQTFQCGSCDKVYSDKYALQQHGKKHEGQSTCRYTCPVCDQLFNNLQDMVYHKEGHNTSTARPCPFVCSTCGKAFARQTYLNMHAKRHKGPQFPCTHCSKVLASKHALETHLRSHSGENPFKCDICDRTFASNIVLERHKFVHSGKSPYLCQVCGKGLMRKDSLAEHEACHMEGDTQQYICDLCGKVIKNKAGFVTHMQTHAHSSDSTTHDIVESRKLIIGVGNLY